MESPSSTRSAELLLESNAGDPSFLVSATGLGIVSGSAAACLACFVFAITVKLYRRHLHLYPKHNIPVTSSACQASPQYVIRRVSFPELEDARPVPLFRGNRSRRKTAFAPSLPLAASGVKQARGVPITFQELRASMLTVDGGAAKATEVGVILPGVTSSPSPRTSRTTEERVWIDEQLGLVQPPKGADEDFVRRLVAHNRVEFAQQLGYSRSIPAVNINLASREQWGRAHAVPRQTSDRTHVGRRSAIDPASLPLSPALGVGAGSPAGISRITLSRSLEPVPVCSASVTTSTSENPYLADSNSGASRSQAVALAVIGFDGGATDAVCDILTDASSLGPLRQSTGVPRASGTSSGPLTGST